MKINFEKMPCYVDIRKAAKMELNVKFELANQLYINGRGVACGALALKIYNSNGEEEYSKEECNIIKEFSQNFSPIFYDSVEELIDSNRDKENT